MIPELRRYLRLRTCELIAFPNFSNSFIRM